MTCTYCDKPVQARGMCTTHYSRWRRQMPLVDRCTANRCPKFAQVDGLCRRHMNLQVGREGMYPVRDKALDLLGVDGGWLTAAGVAVDLNCSVEVVERELRRLRRLGLVESKVVELAWSKGGYERRMEWRAV